MLNFVAAAVMACCGCLCTDMCACGYGCNCPCSPETTASVPHLPGIPGKPAQAADTGQAYRTYSYQPAVSPSYRSSGRATRVAPHMSAGRHSAGFKLTDF